MWGAGPGVRTSLDVNNDGWQDSGGRQRLHHRQTTPAICEVSSGGRSCRVQPIVSIPASIGSGLKPANELSHMIMEGRSFSGHERNCCFLNTGQERFATVSAISGLDFPDDARGIAVTDWDQDGDQDVWISNRNGPRLRFMRNQSSRDNHFLSLRLEGDGRQTNRDAIGARVIVESLGATDESRVRQIQTLCAGEGFLSQSSKWLHFGLGANDSIERVTVHWPGGDPQTFTQLEADGRYVISQHQAEPQRLVPADRPLVLQEQEPELPPETRVARVVLETPLPMLTLEYQSAAGGAVTERFDQGKPTLVNLWASWCRPCLTELADFTAHQEQLEQSGLRIISLSVDQANEPPTPPEDVERLVQQLGYPFPWGHLEASQLDYLQGLHNLLFFLRRPLPLPSSFLVDAQGRLSVIYRGAVSADQLLEDVRQAERGTEVTTERSACLPGRSIEHPRVRAVAKTTETQTRHRVASWLQAIHQIPDAIDHFVALVQSDSTSSLALTAPGKDLP